MIKTLSISNYALIENLKLDFTSGLNIVTGETGAGKSIMLGALSMLFGNRADTRVVTDKAKKSAVEAVFDISAYRSIKSIIEANDIEWDENELILRREINPAGRSRSFINDTPVQLTLLREVAVHLVDIHSQHQNLLLATPEYQLSLIDTLLPDKSVKEKYAQAYDNYRTALRKYQITKRAVESGRAEVEYYRFQLQKLAELNPQAGEQEELEQERDVLANAGDIKEALRKALSLFGDDDGTVVDMLRSATAEIESLSSLPDAESLAERIDSLRIEANDIAETLESLENRIEANPARLEQVEERLSEIYEMQRKFEVDTIEGLLALREELELKVDAIDNGDERVKMLATKAKIAKKEATAVAAELSLQRAEVAKQFAKMLCDNAIPLGMKNLQVDIALTPSELSPTGADNVEFLFAFNKNQPLMPVKDTASGGEISRLMLTVKAIVADKIQLPSIIFDEIDTGVSGDVANRMGEMMKDISQRIQVIAITHLPQVASKGDAHYKVFKEDSELRTHTYVKPLDIEGRISELALMLSGDSANAAARATAQSLLNVTP
ncbi:MAG: DNA repair protein RecN [Muribaculaceae bacterium]|nr:DNA repair protein RecN [Muribaculaceae bacterium]